MLHIINRHCKFSNLSANKDRPSFFSRESCFRNLLKTSEPYKDILKLHVLFDGDVSGHFLSEERFSFINPIILKSGSGARSFYDSVLYALNVTSNDTDIIYFLEDDYLHRPDWPKVLIEGINIDSNSYCTLYDHNDKYYTTLPPELQKIYEPMYKNLKSRITTTKSVHWRTVSSTTDTFAITRHMLVRYLKEILYFSTIAHHSLDHDRGLYLEKLGVTLWSCLPGYSTHMAPEYMSPIIDWETINNQTQ